MEETETRPAVVPPEQPEEKSFIASLFDFSFTSFVTPNLVRLLYGMALLWVAVVTFRWIFEGGVMDIIWRSLLSPLALVVGVILSRAGIEIIMVAFRIFELLKRIDERQRREQRGDTPKE